MDDTNIHNFVKSQESAYMLPVFVADGYEWGMKEHIRDSMLYKNSRFTEGADDMRPFKNIVLPILNLQYWVMDFDVKDIELFVNSKTHYYKSFIIRKYHDKWAREHRMDEFIDDVIESYVDYGGTLVKKGKNEVPEVVPLQSLAFCDQTNILGGPIGIRHHFSPSELLEMSSAGWGNPNNGATITLEELITLAKPEKEVDKLGLRTSTPGRYVEVYEIHGDMTEAFLDGNPDKFTRQLHIIAFYKDAKGEKKAITLFKGKGKKDAFKFIARDKIFGRALGRGGVEELFQPQIWTNYGMIRKRQMLDAASKIFYQTADAAFRTRNRNLSDIDNNEVLVYEEGKPISPVNNSAVNLNAFNNSIAEWEANGQVIGAANDSIMGKSPPSGTPFALQELVVNTSSGLHARRQGKIAEFMDEIYRDWIIPHLAAEAMKGQDFITELDLDELQSVADQIVNKRSNDLMMDRILEGHVIYDDELEAFKLFIRDEFVRGGSKRFISILKDEMKDAPIDVHANIAGKQKDMAKMVDKLVNVFRQVIQAPQVLDDPRMGKLFNEILEKSGLSPIDFHQPQRNRPMTEGVELNMQQPQETATVV